MKRQWIVIVWIAAALSVGPALAGAAETGKDQETATADQGKRLKGYELSKNTWLVGLFVDYSTKNRDNVRTSFENLSYADDKVVNLRLGGGWFFRRNAAVGLGFSMGKKSLSKEVINLLGPSTVTESDTNLITMAPFIRYYIPLGAGGHFHLLNQLAVQYGSERGAETTISGANTATADLKKDSYGLVYTPGLAVFIAGGFALEVTVGIGGVTYSVEKKIQAGLPDAVTKSADIDLRIDILKLQLGFSYYF